MNNRDSELLNTFLIAISGILFGLGIAKACEISIYVWDRVYWIEPIEQVQEETQVQEVEP